MIKLSIPHLAGNEKKYVDEAVESTWIVPLGPFVDEFEYRLGDYLHHKDVVALSAGTAAIHLGLVMAGVKAGDEVICQSLTFSASCNPIVYLGASPVLVDSEPETWNMSPSFLEEAIISRKKATGRYPAAIVVVHLYGMPARMDEIMAIASRYGIAVVEDAAEALGSEFDGKKCGTIGDYGVLSFNGNKIITTSGGGALICPDKTAADRVKFLSTQARENRPYYYHTTIGYNYRLSNVSAAIGCAQIEELPDRVKRRRCIHGLYSELLAGAEWVTVHDEPSQRFRSNFWLSTVSFDKSVVGRTPDEIRMLLLERGIETRLIWRPMHMQPVFADAPYYGGGCSDGIFENGLCLPSGTTLSDDDIAQVAEALKECLAK
ncbi:MAG: DegT/DnrJ/EryC1/StrS family aminotransferase [Muribaculaceae bacterium]|jgi:Predicted pyridoxal phosphate-dependent enzyme apparently involved in regulation of cell wall biogenesis